MMSIIFNSINTSPTRSRALCSLTSIEKNNVGIKNLKMHLARFQNLIIFQTNELFHD